MQVIFDGTRPVKPSRRFGAGLTRHDQADEREYAQMQADRAAARRDYDQHIEERALHSLMTDRLCRGPLF